MLPKQTTLTASPQDSMRALQRAVAGQFDWRIQSGGEDERPRFVIEKQVRYNFGRGWPMVELYQIIGGFQRAPGGETTLTYSVSGQPWKPFFRTAFYIGLLLIFTIVLAMSIFSLPGGSGWIGLLLVGVLIATIVAYGVLVFRGYQGHLRELEEFMQAFVRRNGSGQG